MLVMIELKYANPDKKSGILKYRRRIPKALQLALGKTELVVSFKTTNHELVLSMYDHVHNRIERELANALEKSPEGVAYQATLKDLEKYSLIESGETALSPYGPDTDQEPDMRFASTLHNLAVAKGAKSGPETWDLGRGPHAGTAQQCCLRHEGHPARCGSSLQMNSACVWRV